MKQTVTIELPYPIGTEVYFLEDHKIKRSKIVSYGGNSIGTKNEVLYAYLRNIKNPISRRIHLIFATKDQLIKSLIK